MFIILNGAFQFFSDLNESLLRVRAFKKPKDDSEDVIIRYYFQRASSYRNTESTGNVLFQVNEADCKGGHILIIEDIYDTGATMMKMFDVINQYGAASVKSCVLLHKKEHKNLKHNYWPEYCGFSIPLLFIIGYGLDFNEYVRDMRHICTASSKCVEKFSV